MRDSNLKTALDLVDRYEAYLIDLELQLRRTSETLRKTCDLMHLNAMLPKAQRNPDWDLETLIRYNAHAAQAESAHHITRKKVLECLSITTEELTAYTSGTSSPAANSASTTTAAPGAKPGPTEKRI